MCIRDRTLLWEHYVISRGRFRTFDLPAEAWSGTADPTVFTPDGYEWRYVGPPEVEDSPRLVGTTPSSLHDVTVELEMVPVLPIGG